MLLPQPSMGPERKRLLRIFDELPKEQRQMLLEFAEFLSQRRGQQEQQVAEEPREPLKQERPEQESVVAAIRRLKESYYMLDRSELLTETASLMTAHVMQGQPAAEVIDQLEVLFEQHYESYRQSGDSEK